MANWGPDYKDPISYLELFTTGNPNNKMNYSNVRYDELIKKAKTDFVLDTEKSMESVARSRAGIIRRCCGGAALSYWLSICTKRIM